MKAMPNAETTPVLNLHQQPPPPEWGVSVDDSAIAALADEWADGDFVRPDFDYPGTPTVRNEGWWFDYVTLAVSVLACLWPSDGDDVWEVDHNGVWLDDAPGIFAAFGNRVTTDGLNLDWFANMTEPDGQTLFAGRGVLQLVPERVRGLRATAGALQQHWQGSALHLVDAAGRDGAAIVRLLNETVPSFSDRPATRAGIAHFDKLSHLAAAIMAAGAGWETAGFHGYDNFPVYPDYMLPRVFRHYGAMIYDAELAQRVDHREIVEMNSPAEHAIRWATVYCGAKLTLALAERGAPVTGPALDYRLWSIAVLGPDATSFGEHHRTITLAY